MILAASGVLDGKKATTKREVLPQEPSPLELMRQRYPRIDVNAASLVDCDGITTGGGVNLVSTLRCISSSVNSACAWRGRPRESLNIHEPRRSTVASFPRS